MAPTPDRIPPFTCNFLVVGEGKGDSAFVKHLCEHRKIDIANFQIEDSGGSGQFESYIDGLKFRRNFDKLKGILIVGDNDDSPDQNFTDIQNHLKKAKLPKPIKRLEVTRQKADGIAVAVMMLPFTVAGGATRGSLETLLLTSVAEANAAVGACIDSYRACIPAGGRTRNEEDKFRLRCFLAALSADDPNISLQYAISPAKRLIDLKHKCFDEIADFLSGFIKKCEA